jgi:hydroxyacylglutathione hydrolase
VALLRTSFPVGALGCTCTIVACAQTREALVIDPGDEAARILGELERQGLRAVSVVHTHAHFDHVLGTGSVAAATGAEIALHKDDRWLYDNVGLQLHAFGFPLQPPTMTPPARELAGGELLAFGRREARVLHTPGHTPGSVCLYVEGGDEQPILFSGDTLFAGSVGRTDLWGGSLTALVESIRGPLFALPEQTLVVPGHGPETTIGLEQQDNRYVRGVR